MYMMSDKPVDTGYICVYVYMMSDKPVDTGYICVYDVFNT